MKLKVVKAYTVEDTKGDTHHLELCVGDLLGRGAGEPELLMISSFPDDYSPVQGTVVGALADIGVNVATLAAEKYRDWRRHWQTWFSHPLPKKSPVRQIGCFEHGFSLDPAAVVGNVFRSVSELALEPGGRPIQLLRMPLLATGNQASDKFSMLRAILDQAQLHLRAGLPIGTFQLVIHDSEPFLYALLLEAGEALARGEADWIAGRDAAEDHDIFVSYQSHDRPFVVDLVSSLRRSKRGLRVFIDQESLSVGSVWKPQLVNALFRSRHALCVITDRYAGSVECIDEFHIARCCALSRRRYLVPLLNLSEKAIGELPQSIRSVNGLHGRSPPRDVSEVAADVLKEIRIT